VDECAAHVAGALVERRPAAAATLDRWADDPRRLRLGGDAPRGVKYLPASDAAAVRAAARRAAKKP
jgi:hypothetical protein